jgi:hypothetical protein
MNQSVSIAANLQSYCDVSAIFGEPKALLEEHRYVETFQAAERQLSVVSVRMSIEKVFLNVTPFMRAKLVNGIFDFVYGWIWPKVS